MGQQKVSADILDTAIVSARTLRKTRVQPTANNRLFGVLLAFWALFGVLAAAQASPRVLQGDGNFTFSLPDSIAWQPSPLNFAYQWSADINGTVTTSVSPYDDCTIGGRGIAQPPGSGGYAVIGAYAYNTATGSYQPVTNDFFVGGLTQTYTFPAISGTTYLIEAFATFWDGQTCYTNQYNEGAGTITITTPVSPARISLGVGSQLTNNNSILSVSVGILNSGSQGIGSISLTTIVPSGMIFNAASTSSNCTDSGGTITCTFAALNGYSSANVNIAYSKPTSSVSTTESFTATYSGGGTVAASYVVWPLSSDVPTLPQWALILAGFVFAAILIQSSLRARNS